jgi:hypothetical protein
MFGFAGFIHVGEEEQEAELVGDEFFEVDGREGDFTIRASVPLSSPE